MSPESRVQGRWRSRLQEKDLWLPPALTWWRRQCGQQGGPDVKVALVAWEPSLGANPPLHLEENAQQSGPSC